MSRRYAPDHKYLVLRVMAAVFKGDIVATSQFTGIPERTIRDWFYAYMDEIKREQEAEKAAQRAKMPQRR